VLVFHAALASGGTAIIRATIGAGAPPIVDTLTVELDFDDDNPAEVPVFLSCDSGSVLSNPQMVSEGNPATFLIENAEPGARCTATENPVPAGYTEDSGDCQHSNLNRSCCILNQLSEPLPDLIFYADFEG
jgi:hypothetical protein